MHLTQKQLSQLLIEAKQKITIGGAYRHYKSSQMTYIVKDIAINEADNGPCVIYQALYGNQITFIRPVKEWLETLQTGDKTVQRYAAIYDKAD
ncbi:MAG TPA: DUF1653 domain-containing protein [Candidatus Saccharimonadales bacterium]|nr:DUF1653 domain-containing protein [Candidatus Saccharimonadales bacterium]